MLAQWLQPHDNSIMRIRGMTSASVGSAGARRVSWFPWLMLVWSIWIFLTPLYEPKFFADWKWPTLTSYAVFLLLFYCGYYRDRRRLPWYALGIAALAFLVTPYNPGAQGYMIYACSFFAFCGPPRRALTWMVAVLALYAVQWLWLGWTPLYLVSAVVVGLAVGLMNISFARKAQADAALILSHDEVRRLAALAERERIGRDLHDLLGHTLSLVALKSELAGKLLQREDSPQSRAAAQREIGEVTRVARDALAQVRAAVTGIRAAGMAAELASAKLLLECDGIAFKSAIDDRGLDGNALPPRVETALAMTVREAVTNIQRHARAQQAEIAFEMAGGEAVLRIVDDGRGGAIVPGNGLGGMRERIEALGGRLRIDSGSGRGTRIEARLPLAANDDVGGAE